MEKLDKSGAFREGDKVKVGTEHGQVPGATGKFLGYTVAVVEVDGKPYAVGLRNLAPVEGEVTDDYRRSV